MTKEKFGENGFVYTLENKNGLKLKLADVGASITGIFFKNKKGDSIEVAFGSDDVSFYSAKAKNGHMGATVGRVAGKTLNSSFKIGDKEYKLNPNKAPHHTHGGVDGLSYVFFTSKQIADNKIEFHYLSKDGEEGYPGNLDLTVTYTLTENNEIIIDYKATTDKPTPLNVMNHSYFNLNGKGKINSHKISIDANYYLPENENGDSSGEILKVDNTPYDFRNMKEIDTIIKSKGGCDNCFVFDDNDIKKSRVKVVSEESLISLEVFTDMPSVLLYTANSLNNLQVRGQVLNKHEAFCLETQYFTLALNYNHFPSIILYPDREFKHITIYKFAAL